MANDEMMMMMMSERVKFHCAGMPVERERHCDQSEVGSMNAGEKSRRKHQHESILHCCRQLMQRKEKKEEEESLRWSTSTAV